MPNAKAKKEEEHQQQQENKELQDEELKQKQTEIVVETDEEKIRDYVEWHQKFYGKYFIHLQEMIANILLFKVAHLLICLLHILFLCRHRRILSQACRLQQNTLP